MTPAIVVTELRATPNDCPLSDPLTLDMSFEADQDVPNAHWEVQYVVDMAYQRHTLQLGSTEKQNYAAGKSSMHFAVSAIDVTGLKRSMLNNVGLLLIVLKDEAAEVIMQISMLTQIELQGDEFIRHMLSPLE